ncbi:hypothetical protein [Cohnella faecalis]|uniref:hypothetical protein n=1 Tax=Cohnella faecalis TaxID=2315694 RepID=UPI0011C220A4|nr:hypothetical protein [Cohnella faecalis]
MKKGNVFMVPSPLKPGKDAELANATNLAGKLKQVAMTERTVATSDTAYAGHFLDIRHPSAR